MTADRSIAWRSWAKEAFEEAKADDKPILLRLSAVWCHWCHVMDQTSDREPEAIRLLNERFVPIRVDIDQRPDIRDRYSFGGYPTSAFLTPDGEILTGGTYIPPEQFVHLLDHVSRAYRDQKEELVQRMEEARARRRGVNPQVLARPGDEASHLVRAVLEAVSSAVLLQFDPREGGFGRAPKFPHRSPLELALRRGRESNDHANVGRKTLDAMRASALWDREELGFFRYSVAQDWSEPHFEKMLETNAGLLAAYALGASALADARWMETARGIRAYAESVLRNPETGLFGGSQDADEEYYALTLEARRQRKAPNVDPRAFTDWNAQMAEAYFEAYNSFGEPSWLHEGLRTLDGLLSVARRPEGGMFHCWDGSKAEGSGFLGDQAHVAWACMRAYSLTDREEYLVAAKELVAFADRHLWDPQRSQYVDRTWGPQEIGLLAQPHASIVDNGWMARILVFLEGLEPERGHGRRFEEILSGCAPGIERYGIFAAELGLACLERASPKLDVHVVGGEEDVSGLVSEASRIPLPHVRVYLHPKGPPMDVLQRSGIRSIAPPVAFACSENACSRLYRPGERFSQEVLALVGKPRTK